MMSRPKALRESPEDFAMKVRSGRHWDVSAQSLRWGANQNYCRNAAFQGGKVNTALANSAKRLLRENHQRTRHSAGKITIHAGESVSRFRPKGDDAARNLSAPDSSAPT